MWRLRAAAPELPAGCICMERSSIPSSPGIAPYVTRPRAQTEPPLLPRCPRRAAGTWSSVSVMNLPLSRSAAAWRTGSAHSTGASPPLGMRDLFGRGCRSAGTEVWACRWPVRSFYKLFCVWLPGGIAQGGACVKLQMFLPSTSHLLSTSLQKKRRSCDCGEEKSHQMWSIWGSFKFREQFLLITS